jgi:23S rRNA (cytidine1920-2'-O)/16S rRNA (cytidine1409-2'-O)-methyltransferase
LSHSAPLRLDQHLLAQNLASSRSQAQALILAGQVKVDGTIQTKAGFQVKPGMEVAVAAPLHPYVSRGGVKLAGALAGFQLDPKGLHCLDVGAGTGGFTDCLLQHGAAQVVCVDVGYGQLAYRLRQNPQVTVLERINVRYLPAETAPGPFDLIVVDVSFISLTMIIPVLIARMHPSSRLLCLVKPQFEAGRGQVDKGGVVRSEEVRQAALQKIINFSQTQGLTCLDFCPSPIEGAKGNREFLLLLGRGGQGESA